MENSFDLQPTLSNAFVRIQPLQTSDFETLYAAASDPLVWAQHPNPNRYQREIFETFFQGAIASGGAFLVSDAATGQAIGSSRFYDLDLPNKTVVIGYTFLAKDHWGSTYNPALKSLMLNHAFQFVDKVEFHIGAENVRSQKAIERLGAEKIAAKEVAYHGEPLKLNYIYQMTKERWENLSSATSSKQ